MSVRVMYMEMPEFVGRPAAELLEPAKSDIKLLDDVMEKMEVLQVFLSDWSDCFKSNEIQYYNTGVQFIQDAIKYAMVQVKITGDEEWGSFAFEGHVYGDVIVSTKDGTYKVEANESVEQYEDKSSEGSMFEENAA